MAFNQLVIYYPNYVYNTGHTGGILAGISKLSLVGSTHLAGACCDNSGNIYVTDAFKHIVLKITDSGVVSVVGGSTGVSGNNGNATVTAANSRFNYPTGICCDKNGDLYVCDTNNNQIRRISNDKVSLVAGDSAGASGTTDGVGAIAKFNNPYGIDIDNSGNIYVADTFNHSIRKIHGGVVFTIAGLSGTSGNVPVWAQMTTAEGVQGDTARFAYPYALSCNPNGYVFISDTENHVIKRLDPAGRVRIFSGSGTRGRTLGTAKTSTYQDLKFSDFTRSNELYVVDYDESGASRIVRIDEEGVPGNVIDYSAKVTGQYLAAVVCNPAAHLFVIESEYTNIQYSSSSSSSSSSNSSSSSSSSSSSYVENWSSSSGSSSSSSYIENWSSSSLSSESSSSSSSS